MNRKPARPFPETEQRMHNRLRAWNHREQINVQRERQLGGCSGEDGGQLGIVRPERLHTLEHLGRLLRFVIDQLQAFDATFRLGVTSHYYEQAGGCSHAWMYKTHSRLFVEIIYLHLPPEESLCTKEFFVKGCQGLERGQKSMETWMNSKLGHVSAILLILSI